MVGVVEYPFRLRRGCSSSFFGGAPGLRHSFHRLREVWERRQLPLVIPGDVEPDERPGVLLRQHAAERVGSHGAASSLSQLLDETRKIVGRELEVRAEQITGD